MDRDILWQHLLQAERHVARGVVHIARQYALIAELERDGHDVEAARAILATLRETQALHQQDRERLLQEARIAKLARENCTTIDPPKIYRPGDIRKDDIQRAAHLRDMEIRAVELLKQSAPDTFLGRQLHDFIPLPHQQA